MLCPLPAEIDCCLLIGGKTAGSYKIFSGPEPLSSAEERNVCPTQRREGFSAARFFCQSGEHKGS